uniref:Uncharacterized protein n=1 Tax=Oncorhynchus kisutch TaxID=8019 RepID=A0A8C7M792_ONCKI
DGLRTIPSTPWLEIPNKDNLEVHRKEISLEELNESHHDSNSQLNMQGVFLHSLGYALGSVIIVVNALIFTYMWRPCHAGETCVNPGYNSHDYINHQQHVNATLVTMLGTPILLQTVPKQINMHRLLGRVRSLDGQLAESRIIPTAHIKCFLHGCGQANQRSLSWRGYPCHNGFNQSLLPLTLYLIH